MEPNQIVEQPTQPPPTPPEPITSPTLTSKLPIILLVLVSLISLSGFVYFYLQTQSLKQQLNALPPKTPAPTTTIEPSPTTDPTSNWKLYENQEQKFSFKYPSDWKLTQDPTSNNVLLSKKLFREDIVFDKCDSSNDCALEARITITSKEANADDSRPCSVFGECLLADHVDKLSNNRTLIQLEFNRKDAIYPIFTYIIMPNLIFRARSYLPSTKNCEGKCLEREDTPKLKEDGKEIIQILSSFQFIDSQ